MKHFSSLSRLYIIALLLSFLCYGCDVASQSRNKKVILKLQTDLDSELTETNPGILLTISSPDQNIEWSGAAGYSERENKVKLLPDQTFRIASVTKTFVAVTILRLWEDKKLKLDDPISKYISEQHFKILMSGGYYPDKITIRHLLTHSSGLSEHTTSDKYKIDYMKTGHIWTRTEQINDLVLYTKPAGNPGEQFSYSDTGYILLGEIIEKITGESMGDAISDQLQLSKLGLTDTHMEDYNPGREAKRIHQYYENTDTYNFHPSMDYFGGGGLLSTTSDLSLFFHSLFQRKVFRYTSTLDTMLSPVNYKSPQALDYRMGIWRIEINGMPAYTHTGFWGTQVAYIPEKNTVISVNYSQRWPKKGVAPVILKVLNTVMKIN